MNKECIHRGTQDQSEGNKKNEYPMNPRKNKTILKQLKNHTGTKKKPLIIMTCQCYHLPLQKTNGKNIMPHHC